MLLCSKQSNNVDGHARWSETLNQFQDDLGEKEAFSLKTESLHLTECSLLCLKC